MDHSRAVPIALIFVLLSGSCEVGGEHESNSVPAVEAARDPRPVTEGLVRFDGFFPFYWDSEAGRVLLEIPRFDSEFLYTGGLATGLGSNPVGLDRGRFGASHVVHFRRVGPRVLLVERNLRYRATTDNAAERRAVAQSFATSVLWGTQILEMRGGAAIVDATGLLFRDAQHIARTLRRSDQGQFRLDKDRSAVWLPGSKAFPKNTELEVDLTFVSEDPGQQVRETTPTPEAVTLRMHHSLVELPPAGYTPRRFDPRTSSIPLSFADYAQPIDEPLVRQWISRHRLIKKDPTAAKSEPVEPIVYYVDPGAPEPIRSALIEGASWWNEAFEAAGFVNAFQVRVLPEDADPMDLRYNVIEWVHRATRGWSYGRSVRDPRTGEIIKGHVTLGSLRIRQDRMLFEGMTPRFTGACAAADPFDERLAALDPEAKPVEVALARIRQLAAHEVGHTLGFAHNFAASVNDRASVMDYPAPLIKKRDDGSLDFSDAYATGIGEWDKLAVRYAYTEFAPGADEHAGLLAIIKEGRDRGLLFLTDEDSRALGAMQPLSNLWDNGSDPIAELERVLDVRRAGLAAFGTSSIAADEPTDRLEAVLLPLYLHHRYQVQATAKMLGGVFYEYALRGEGRTATTPVSDSQQRKALAVLLRTLSPAELAVPERILDLLAPTAFGSPAAERFPRKTGKLFDPLAAARVAIGITLDAILEPTRAQRLVLQNQRDPKMLSLTAVIQALNDTAWTKGESGLAAGYRHELRRALAEKLMSLAASPRVSGAVRAAATAGLGEALAQAARQLDPLVPELQRFRDRPYQTTTPPARVEPPAGSPIGSRR